MTLTFAGSLDRTTVLVATERVAELVGRREVAEAWDRESSCAGMTVGGLTRHLVGQPASTVDLLGGDPSTGADGETLTLLEHYARTPWVREDLGGEMNRAIRETSDRQAAEGPAHVLSLLAQARSALPRLLDAAPPQTYVPWQGWALETDDFLVVRLMEMVVHSDDLAASVEIRTPDFGEDVLDPVLRLLTAIAVRRHGQDALVRTLTRPQRAPAVVSAF